MKKVNNNSFSEDLMNSLESITITNDFGKTVDDYNTKLANLMDKHAPKTRTGNFGSKGGKLRRSTSVQMNLATKRHLKICVKKQLPLHYERNNSATLLR